MNTATATAGPVWIDATEAARVLETNYQHVRRLAACGFLKTRQLPGCKARYNRRSVERLAESSIAGDAS